MTKLYVVGGQQRHLRSLLAGAQDWYKYQKGVILQVDPETQASKTLVEYVSPPEVCPEQDAAILFKSGTLHDNTLYVCTQTEVLIYKVPEFERVGYISLPHFNDVHHVRPTPDGNLLVVNTGLDMVLEITAEGKVLRTWNTLGEDPWKRFSKETDYRKVASTKPHLSHPNYVFYVDDDVWATRFVQKDALCLSKPNKQIQIGIERCHDGVVHNGLIYFTTVNGHVVIVNAHTLKTEEIINLNEPDQESTLLGWCRGIMVDEDRIWVGFTRLRPTKFRENVSWVKNRFKRSLPTHIACYDLTKRSCVARIDLENQGLNAVFGIFSA